MHKHVTTRYPEWHSGGAGRPEIERHLAECDSCRSYYERMTRLLDPGLIHHLPVLTPDPLLPGTIETLAAGRPRPRGESWGREDALRLLWPRGAVYAAAVVIGIIIGMSFLPEPPEEDLDDIVTLYRQAVSDEDFSNQLDIVLDQTGGHAK